MKVRFPAGVQSVSPVLIDVTWLLNQRHTSDEIKTSSLSATVCARAHPPAVAALKKNPDEPCRGHLRYLNAGTWIGGVQRRRGQRYAEAWRPYSAESFHICAL